MRYLILLLLLPFIALGQGSPEGNSFRYKSNTTTERDAFGAYSDGARLVYNSTTQQFEYKVGAGSWIPLATGGGSGTPGGLDTHIQYNNAGVFGGSSNFTYDGTQVILSAQNTQDILTVSRTDNTTNNTVARFENTQNGAQVRLEYGTKSPTGANFTFNYGAWADDTERWLAFGGGPDLRTQWVFRIERDLGTVEATGNISTTGTVTGTNIIQNNISGRVGTPLTGIQIETQAQISANPALAADESVLCSNCAPLTDSGGATIDFSDSKLIYDDRVADAATITFSNLTVDTELQVGAYVKVYFKRPTEPAYAGAVVNQVSSLGTFPADKECYGLYVIDPDGEIEKFFVQIEP